MVRIKQGKSGHNLSLLEHDLIPRLMHEDIADFLNNGNLAEDIYVRELRAKKNIHIGIIPYFADLNKVPYRQGSFFLTYKHEGYALGFKGKVIGDVMLSHVVLADKDHNILNDKISISNPKERDGKIRFAFEVNSPLKHSYSIREEGRKCKFCFDYSGKNPGNLIKILVVHIEEEFRDCLHL